MTTNKQIGSILLIVGTCVGAGMLALPVATAESGFFDSLILLAVAWFSMWLTGLYVLEANLGVPEGSNFIAMAKATLGKTGEVVTWAVYLLLLYSLIAAYLSGGGALLMTGIHTELRLSLSNWWGPIPWVVVVGAIIYLGPRRVDGFNRLLVLGLVITYFILVFVASPSIKLVNLEAGRDPVALLFALPIALTSFGYHVIVPSIRSYLKSDAKKIAKVIFWGSIAPLIVYALWDMQVFGTIPIHGAEGLDVILKSGQPASHLIESLSVLLKKPIVTDTASVFIFFAIATSFLGISFSLSDFVSDSFNIRKTRGGWMAILAIVFIPPLFFAWLFPRGFILALSYAGVFVAILHGILPALMVWIGRKRGLVKEYKAPGGLIAILAILAFSLVVIVMQVIANI